MRILAISDVESPQLQGEFDPARFAGVDLIFSCGDLAPEYLTLVRERVDAPLYYVLGNHDLRYDQSPPVGCSNISCTTAVHDQIKLLGLSGSRWYNGGPNQYHETEMRMIVWKLYFALWRQQGVDIVIAHAPPRHVGDAEDRCHRGFKFFHNLINRFQPPYFLHGHIHTHFADNRARTTMLGSTRVINCCGYHVFKTDDI